MCDGCEFYIKRSGDIIEVSTLLLEKIASVQEDDTCCEDARGAMLSVFGNVFLNLNEGLAHLAEAVSEMGTEEEKKALRTHTRKYHIAIVKNLQFMTEALAKKTDQPPSLDWEGVFGNVFGKTEGN